MKVLCAKARYVTMHLRQKHQMITHSSRPVLIIIALACREILIEESNVQRIDPPVTVSFSPVTHQG